MVLILYDIFICLSIVLLLPYFLFKMIFHKKYRSGIFERFGIIGKKKLAPLKNSEVVWFHAVSVGETKAVIPLLKAFKAQRPNTKILFSTVTRTGQRVAEKECADFIDALIYFPIDLSWVVKSIIRRVRPKALIVVEKEIWPNIVAIMRKRSIPVAVVNGSISDKSFKGYKRAGFIFRRTYGALSLFSGITELDTKKAVTLGTPQANATTSGNLKFDMTPPEELSLEEGQTIQEVLRINDKDLVIVAGSTHAGEEVLILEAFKELLSFFPKLKLIIAPRHPERFAEVESIVRATAIPYIRRSRGAEDSTDHKVIILDTLGELGAIYNLATVAFIGGTLVDTGGHNLLEPALFRKPVIYGPYLKSYRYMAEIMEAKGASRRIKEATAERVLKVLKKLLTDKDLREEMG
ncbi:MAG: 3-deoxy-D-manno-octulosonic acid transferase, partial [Deltaproteobacteria bacterium]|nr:3-deoxy-D-manno-octulosonic acid transferase [Deltaproteobacteria bacterium]